MQAAILAGGLATRLMPLTKELPKSLVPVCGRPFVEHQLALLRSHGITDIVMLVGHLAEMIEDELGDGARLGMSIRYSDEGAQRLDTAGALKLAEPLLDDRFMVLFGDSYLQLDYRRIAQDFIASGKAAMMSVYRNDGQFDTSDVRVEGSLVTAYQKDPPLPGAVFINYGLTLLKKSTLAAIGVGERISLQRFLQPLVAAGQLAAWEATERFYEIGSFSGIRDLETLLGSQSEQKQPEDRRIIGQGRQHMTTVTTTLADTQGGSAETAETLASTREQLRLAEGALELDLARRRSLQAAYQRLQAAYQGLQSSNDEVSAKVAALEADLERVQRRLDFVYRTTSWRITLPLRLYDQKVREFKRFLNRRKLRHTKNMPATAAEMRAELPAAGDGPLAGCELLMAVGPWEGESRRYRVHNVADALRRRGHRVGELSSHEVGQIVDCGLRPKVVVLFRAAWDSTVQRLLDYATINDIRVIFDVDDLVFEPTLIPMHRGFHKLSDSDKLLYTDGVGRYRKLLKLCDAATVSTETLAQAVRAVGRPASVIRNSLNHIQLELAEHLVAQPRPPRDHVLIGYFSGTATHDHDFMVAEPSLLRLMRERPGLKLLIVGPLDLSEAWDDFAARIERLDFQPYQKMLATLRGCDLAIAPLEMNNPFNEAKSELKWFEAAVVEVPVVASATAPNRAAVDHGRTGYVVEDDAGWYAALSGLIDDPALRRRIGTAARESALRTFSPEVVADEAEAVFGLTKMAPAVEPVARDGKMSVDWIVPGLTLGSGGHRNILRCAYYLEKFGHQVRLHFVQTQQSAAELKSLVRKHFYPIEAEVKVYDRVVPYTDVLFATHWSTVDTVLASSGSARCQAYFVQDFEPLFEPMGTGYIVAENTYRQGLYCVTSGPWCAKVLEREFNCDVDTLAFPMDRSVYYPRLRRKRTRNVVFFAKPEMPRRCYELGILMLQRLHRLMPDLEIIMYGSQAVEGQNLGFPYTPLALLPTIEDLAELYSDADAGIVFSTTNPSLVSYEMMACGTPLVDLDRPGNEFNYGGRRDIALMADPRPERMAEQVKALLLNAKERDRRIQAGIDFAAKLPTEEEMVRLLEKLLLARLAKTGFPR